MCLNSGSFMAIGEPDYYLTPSMMVEAGLIGGRSENLTMLWKSYTPAHISYPMIVLETW